MVLACVASALSVLAIYDRSLVDQLERDAERTLRDEWRVVDNRIIFTMADLMNDARYLAQVPAVVEVIDHLERLGTTDASGAAGRDQVEQSFAALLEAKPHYLQVRVLELISDDAREVVRVDRLAGGDLPEVFPVDRLQSKGDTTYVQMARGALMEQALLSRFDLNREFGELTLPLTPVVRALAPIRLPDGCACGLVVINLDLNRFFERLRSVSDSEVTLRLIDDRGLVLLDEDGTLGPGFGIEAGEPQANAFEELLRTSAVDGGMERIVRGPTGVTGISALELGGGSRPLRLGIEVSVDDSHIVSTRLGAVSQAVVWILLTLALIAAVTLRVVAWIQAPLLEVAADIGRPRSQNDFEPVPEPEQAEAGAVARNFNGLLAAMRDHRAELQRTNAELQQFSSVASHDLKEPVRTIHSFSALLKRQYGDVLDTEGHRILGFMESASARMLSLIDDLLAHARLGNKRSIEPVDLAGLTGEVLEDLSSAIADAGADVEVGSLPVVAGNRSELRVLQQNLISNALKFRRSDTPCVVRIGAVRSGSAVTVHVDDNGIGMDEELRTRAFEMFVRGHSRESYAGSGIGLAHCRKIVELHGGRISVTESTMGGTRVEYSLRGVDVREAPVPASA